ncbi:beta-N-acetylhexosaminidase [Amorphus suaedae]
MPFFRSACVAFFALATGACVAASSEPAPVQTAAAADRSCAPRSTPAPAGVSVEEMVGQLLVVGFTGKTPASASATAVRTEIAEGRVGGVLFLRHNIGSAADVKALTASFASAGTPPPLIMIDQEGGLVSRLPAKIGFPATPSAEAVARDNSPEKAHAIYAKMAQALKAWGFNVNLAPIADVAVNPNNPVIAKAGRAYASDPRTVAAYDEAFVTAHRAAGVAPTLKHFPGHGSSASDSHDGAVDITRTWSEAELVPYRELIDAGLVDIIMVGHLRLDRHGTGTTLPASISPDIIEGMLRSELCFNGVVMTDDLIMHAIRNRMSATDAVIAALKADSDLIVVSGDSSTGPDFPQKVAAAVAAEAARDPDFLRSIAASYGRVMALKNRFARSGRS